MRSWRSAKSGLGVVVRIVQVSICFPCGSVHRSQSPAKAKSSASPTSKQNGCLILPFFSWPLVESVGGNQAALRLEWFAERSCRGHGFGTGIDGFVADRGVGSPGRNQAPAHQRQFAARLVGLLTNDWDRLSGGDVVARAPVGLERVGIGGGAETLLENLLSP